MNDIPDVTPRNFEEMTRDLEQILAVLEDGSTTLEESLAQYERGIHLVRKCHEFLARSEMRIREFAGIGEDGKLITKPFDLPSNG